jgi:hypothetical protein
MDLLRFCVVPVPTSQPRKTQERRLQSASLLGTSCRSNSESEIFVFRVPLRIGSTVT